MDKQEEPRRRPVLIIAWLAMFLVSFDVASLTIAMPSIADEFSVGTSTASWAVLSYMLVMTCLLLPAGTLSHRFGIRTVLLFGLAIFAIASVGCALSRNMVELVGFRAVQGAGGAMLYVVGPAMIRRVIPEQFQGRSFAFYTTAASAGMSLGPAIGGLLTYHFGWPWIFLVNLPICAIGIGVVLRGTQSESLAKTEETRIDVPGLLIFMIAAVSFVFGLNQGREQGWGSALILGSFALGIVALGAFIHRELRDDDPVLDLRLFARPAFSLGNVGVFGLTFVTGGLLFLLPFYLEWYRGLDSDMSGYMMLIQPVVMILVSVLAGYAIGSERMAFPLVSGSFCLALALVILALVDRTTWLIVVVLSFGLVGLGRGLYLPRAQHHVMRQISGMESGMGSAVNSIVRVLAQLMGIVVFETIFSQRYVKPIRSDYGNPVTDVDFMRLSGAFDTVFWFAAAAALVSLAPCLLPLRERINATAPRGKLPDDA